MGAAHGVGPLAVGADAEAAVAAGHVALRHEQVGRAVCVGGGQRAAGRLDGVGFTQGGSGRAIDYCRVVGAVQDHLHRVQHATGTVNDDAVGVTFARHKLVVRAVHGVRPCAVSIHLKCAVQTRYALGYNWHP